MNIFAIADQAGSTTLWEDILEYIKSVYFGVDEAYEKWGFSTNTIMSLRLAVLGLFLGTVIACLAMAYNKQVIGGFVRKLLNENVNSPENAKALDELGYKKNPFINSAVARNVNLRKVLRCAEEETYYKAQAEERAEYNKKRSENPSLPRYRDIEYVVDSKNDSFYIPEELKDTAERKFYAKGSSWLTAIIGIIVLSIVFFVFLIALPGIIDIIGNFVDGIKNKEKTLSLFMFKGSL